MIWITINTGRFTFECGITYKLQGLFASSTSITIKDACLFYMIRLAKLLSKVTRQCLNNTLHLTKRVFFFKFYFPKISFDFILLRIHTERGFTKCMYHFFNNNRVIYLTSLTSPKRHEICHLQLAKTKRCKAIVSITLTLSCHLLLRKLR